MHATKPNTRRALALALDYGLRHTSSPSRRSALAAAVDWLDPELNADGIAPQTDGTPADSRSRQHTARRLRLEAAELTDTREAELWRLAADVVEESTTS